MKGRKPEMKGAPDAVAEVPRAPSWLSKDAQAEWRRIMPLLVQRRILTAADMGMVESYCVAQGRVREFEARIQAAPDIEPTWIRMQDKAIQTARQIASELGLTPVSRSRPSIRDDQANDDLADLDL